MKNSSRYEPPTIVRNAVGLMNKVGRRGGLLSKTHIDGVAIDALIRDYGSPLFVFSESCLRNRVREVRASMKQQLPHARLGWSYKTNYLGAICSVFHQEGSVAEVVSGMEYEMARRLGVEGHEIIFNGPAKTESELARAIQERAILHADHFEELRIVESLARSRGAKVQVGVRVALDAGIVPRWDRFGFGLESGAAMQAIQQIAQSPYLELGGLHTHIGTYILDPTAYARSATKMAELAQQATAQYGQRPAHLDFGGGFASNNNLSSQYQSGALVPRPDEYIREISRALVEANAVDTPVFLETGRALVDDAGTLLATVLATKRLPTGRASIVIDAGVNLLFTSWWYRLEMTPQRSVDGFVEDTTVYGPLCMNIDCVREAIALPPMAPGDVLSIRPVGAYTFTQSMQFIHLRPACVLIDEQGRVDVIRRREILDDLVGPEQVPARLLLTSPRRSCASAIELQTEGVMAVGE
jgi:diaminopimelate decarboxylase